MKLRLEIQQMEGLGGTTINYYAYTRICKSSSKAFFWNTLENARAQSDKYSI